MDEREWLPTLRAWRARGAQVEVHGLRVFALDAAGSSHTERPPLVVLHGFPSSSFDWHLALPELARERRVILFDFPGYGFSAKPVRHGYSLFEQIDVAPAINRFLRAVDAR